MLKNFIRPSSLLIILFALQFQKALTLHTTFFHTVLLVISFYLLRQTKYIKYFLFAILACSFIYGLFSKNYGLINTSQIASLLQSNANEMLGFLPTMPLRHYLLAALLIISSALYYLPKYKNIHPVSGWQKILAIILFAIVLHQTHFVGLFKHAYAFYKQEDNQLITAQKQSDSWLITSNKQENKTIVVVIGESVRKDYLSLYGYPLATTPFLDKAPGLFIDGYVSTSFNTVDSLSRTLTQSNGVTFDMNNTVVTLANKAGYDTTWISNQGYIGDVDTPAATIAIKSHHRHFFNKGDFWSETNDDEKLLPYLQTALQQPGRKVIFLHMMGSHENVCNRLFSFGVRYHRQQGAQLDCYISSIAKLDQFLEKTYRMVAASTPNFSLIYFSDHGLTIETDPESGSIIKHGNQHHQNYEVPLFLMSSSIHTHQYIHRDISALHFLSFFADELGVTAQGIDQDDLMNPAEDQGIHVWDGRQFTPYTSLSDNFPLH